MSLSLEAFSAAGVRLSKPIGQIFYLTSVTPIDKIVSWFLMHSGYTIEPHPRKASIRPKESTSISFETKKPKIWRTKKSKNEILDYRQRKCLPACPRRSAVGSCSVMAQESREAKAHPYALQFGEVVFFSAAHFFLLEQAEQVEERALL